LPFDALLSRFCNFIRRYFPTAQCFRFGRSDYTFSRFVRAQQQLIDATITLEAREMTRPCES
jgi:hypothetical protein